jgi:hypothetical protein
MFKKLAKLKPSVLTVGKLSPDDFFVVLDDAIRPWNPGDTIQGMPHSIHYRQLERETRFFFLFFLFLI